MKNYINKIHYSKKLDFIQNIIKGVLIVFTPFYSFANKFRACLYSIGILKAIKLRAYVISIGNLTTGGTGKTPLTIAITNHLKDKFNKKAAVLSRGYGGQLSNKNVNIISDGSNILYSSQESGDEPYLIALKTNKSPVLTGKSRINSGKYAIENLGADVLILDDGFQHIKLQRDLNILIVDAHNRFGNEMILPAGPLRESLNEIKRADKIVLINKNSFNSDKTANISDFAKSLHSKFSKPVYICSFKYGEIYNIKTNEPLNSETLNVFAFAGIAHPKPFFEYLSGEGYNLVGKNVFIDHYSYSEQDILNLIQDAKKLGAEAIITTEKDCVKLVDIVNNLNLNIPICALKLGLDLDLDSLLDR